MYEKFIKIQIFLGRIWLFKIARVATYIIIGSILFVLIFMLAGRLFFPLPLDKLNLSPSVNVVDRHGRLLRAFTTPDEMWRITSNVDEVSPKLKMAALNYEDKYFRFHNGVNPVSVVKAAVTNLKARRIVRGGSTITMQVARMMEPKPRTFKNKIVEVLRSIQLELSFSKDEILTFYFNLAPYGGNIVGSAAASHFYFNKDQRDLSLGEAALLAAIPNSPTILRPDAPSSLAKQGRDKVLTRLLENKKINHSQYQEAITEPVPEKRFPMPFLTPHLAQVLKNRHPRTGRIISTIDKNIQILAKKILQDHIIPLRRHGVTTGAIVVMDTKSHEVLALVGSADFFDDSASGQVNGAMAPRSPGSALKPFVYALAMDRGLISQESLLTDVPVDYSGYRPVNYDERFRGSVTTREALSNSLNVPAVNISSLLEVEEGFYEFLRRAGITTLKRPKEHYGLAIVLGGCGVTLLELANLYAGLANMGEFAPYRLTLDKLESPGEQKKPNSIRLLREGTAYVITEMLTEVTRPDLPKVWQSAVNLPKVAWKTGTSYGHKDAWSIGYSPQFTIGVWVGNFNPIGSPVIIGAEAAGPVLFDLFNELSKQRSSNWYVKPDEVKRRAVCAISGMEFSPHCPQLKYEYYIPGVSPNKICDVHREFAIDKKTHERLCSQCRVGREYEMKVFEILPPKIATWMEKNNIAVDKIPNHYSECTALISGEGPVISSPSANCVYTIRPGVDVEYQKILLEASVSNDTSNIYWFVNSKMVSYGSPTERVFITPAPGRHKLVCMDDQGRTTEMTILIKNSD